MVAEGLLFASWRRGALGLVAAFALSIGLAAPAAASEPPPAAGTHTTDFHSEMDQRLPHQARTQRRPRAGAYPERHAGLQGRRTSGAYVGFIAGVIGANPDRAEALVTKMLTIAPADQWVLVRAIAYSGLPNWKSLLRTFADRLPTRRAMIDKYLGGKLPTLDQIAFQPEKPGMIDKIKAVLKIDSDRKKPVELSPSPELIDILWGYYLATGSYPPIHSIIKLLPLSNDKDSVDNLTTGSAAKFTLASNAVRDLTLLGMLRYAAKHESKEVVAVLNGVIETAEDVDTARMRKELLAAIEELKQKGPNSKRELTGWGQVGEGALSMGCVVAAATGQIELGIPCVIGGAAYSAGMQYIAH